MSGVKVTLGTRRGFAIKLKCMMTDYEVNILLLKLHIMA